MVQYLEDLGYTSPLLTQLKSLNSLEAILAACNAKYFSQGLASLKNIPDQSIDFIWSHAVLEHIRAQQFVDVMQELCRILKPTGICSHQVDLRDHLGGGLNHLRIGTQLWEQDWFANSGFYTNRINYEQMLKLFNQAGFTTKVSGVNRWDRLPIALHKLAPEFQSIPEDILRVAGFTVVLAHAS
jgi:SAM-dependent methyltransferase